METPELPTIRFATTADLITIACKRAKKALLKKGLDIIRQGLEIIIQDEIDLDLPIAKSTTPKLAAAEKSPTGLI